MSRSPRSRSATSRSTTHHNNLDGLRIVGAMLVLIGHATVLTGRGDLIVPPTQLPLEFFGVTIFFSISGYLIAASWDSSRSLRAYAWARCLRIFPALALVVLATIVVIGPVLTTWSLTDYASSSQTWAYLKNIGLYLVPTVPGTLADVPFPGSVNGSLWTLSMEFACYLAVPVLVLRNRRWRTAALVGAVLVLAVVANLEAGSYRSVWSMNPVLFSRFAVFFMAGALLHVLVQRHGRDVLRPGIAALAVAGFVVASAIWPEGVHWYAWLFLPYAVLTMGLASTPVVRDAARHGDLSYGIYLWAFPVQQMVMVWHESIPLIADLVVVTVLTTALAAVSWYLVERPTLRLKTRLVPARPQATAGSVV